MFKNMFEEIDDRPGPAAGRQGEEEALGRAESGFVGLDNQGATCYLNALLQAIYMTPELRHGLYAVDPKDLGGDKYEAEREQDRENEKTRLAKERARLKKHKREGLMQPDPEIVKGLLGMFPEMGARRAALKTNNKGFEAALEWALQHSEDKNFTDPLPGYDDDDGADAAGRNGGLGEVGAEDGGGAIGKKKKGGKAKSAKMIPLELQRLFARLQLLDARTVSTEDLTERGFKWKNDEGRMQHDAHELIRLLIDRLERDMKLSKVNAGLVSALYEGDLANQVKCLFCGHVSERREKYRDILLQVAGQDDLVTSLLSYTRPERLSGDNKYFCDQCQEKQDALRSQTLRALPPVLIFSLNRFEFDFETLERVKVNQAFKYPLTLDMEPFVEGRAWVGNDNSDESQVPALAGDPDAPGTCRNRQTWVPQAWKHAEREVTAMLDRSLLGTDDLRQAVNFLGEGGGLGGQAGVSDGGRGKGKGFPPAGGGAGSVKAGGGGGGGEALVYDLLAVVVHRGSAYSGHYHALIRDCLQEGRWLPPAGLNPYQTLDVAEGEGGGEGGEKDKDGTAGEGGNLDESKQRDAGAARGEGMGKEKGHPQMGPKELLLDIFREAPKHEELGRPCMRLPELRYVTKARLDGRRWEKVFHVRLDKYLKDRPEVFMLQESEEGPVEVLLLETEEGGMGDDAESPNAGTEDPELAEVLRLSMEQSGSSKREGTRGKGKRVAPANGTALQDGSGGGVGKGSKAKLVPPGTVDALASEKHGRWFSFDDRKVTPISIRDLEKPFSGAETAYLLIYRSRSLDQETCSPVTPAEIAAALSNAGIGKDRAVAGTGAEGEGAPRALPGGLHMTSVPPSYWMDKVDTENESLKTVKDDKEAGLHGLKLRVWLPKLLQPQMPHLVPLDPTAHTLKQLPEELRVPLVLHLDDRQTLEDLKREAAKRLGEFCREMGVPDLGRARLSELKPHGPGLFLSQHLSHQPERPSSPSSSSKRGSDRRRSGQGQGRHHNRDRDGNPRGKGAAATPPASAIVLGDVEWGLPEEPCVLMWDGAGIGGVELPEPTPETRPIALVVSVLREAEDAGQAGWIDSVLQQAGTFGPVSARDDARVETTQKWKDVYARAGVTAAEVVDLVSEKGPAEVAASTMCISLLRTSSSSSLGGGGGDANDFHGSGRRRLGGSGALGGGVQMEAVQIAGPAGMFQEWRPGPGGKHGTAGAESSGLDLSEGSELLVEEQGAVSKLITSDFASLAEMEAARRNRLVRVEVEVDDSLLETLKAHHVPLAHDVAVALHEGRQVTLHLECDAHATSIPHLKARCLLDLVPALKEDLIPSYDLEALLHPPPPPTTGTTASSGTRDELALVGLIKTVRLEHKKSGNALDESSTGASLFAARIADGASLLLEWGAPPATGKALVKFYVRVGNSMGTARDPARGGTSYGPLDVIADLKEPVSALKARMVAKAAEMSYIVQDDQERRIRVEALMGDSNTLIEELKDVDTDGKGKVKGGDTAVGGASSAGVDEEDSGKQAEGEGDGEAGGATGKSKKKRKKKKGGGGSKGPAVEKDGVPEENSSNGAAAAAADAATTADEAAMTEGGKPSPLFQERLVEESGILGGQEVYLEDGRAPKPRELEVTVLAYAPHFLGLAAAAAAEKLKLKKALSSSSSSAGGGVDDGAGKANGKGGAANGKGDGEVSGFVPTGLSIGAVWPDDEEKRKKADVDKHRADPVRLLSLQRQLSMRTLGRFHIDERQSLTQLRTILRGFLSDGLKKATKASVAEAMRAEQEAEAARAAASASEAASRKASGGDADADADVMAEDEIEGIREIMKMKAKNPKSRKKRNSHGRGGAAGNGGTPAGNSTTTPAKPPPPPAVAEPRSVDRGGEEANGKRSGGDDVVDAAAEESQQAKGGDGDADAGGGGVSKDRGSAKEVKTELADSDDEISLPEGVPGFEALEDAMLVRELRKDRLPGKIIRAGDDGSGDTAGGIFVGKPISELHLSASVALVICLRPRLPQTPLAVEAKMSRREKLANELVENGQANVSKASESLADQGEEEDTKELTLDEQMQQLEEAEANLAVLETHLTDLQKTRQLDLDALKLGNSRIIHARKTSKSRDQHDSIRAWEKELKTRKDRIDTTNLREEKPLEKEVKAMKKAVEKLKNRVKKMEQEEGKEQDKGKGSTSASTQGTDSWSLFTHVKGVIFSSAKTLGFDVADEPAQLRSEQEKEKEKEKEGTSTSSNRKDADWGWSIPANGPKSAAKKPKGGGGKGAGKKTGASCHPPPSSATDAPGEAAAGGNGGAAVVAAATSSAGSPETSLADLQRARDDAIERRRTDPSTDLHLWTFWRKNPLGDGGTLPVDYPEWPGPLKEVIVEDTSQPTLDNLHEALGKAYGIPASRVWAIKHNWGKREWARLTREMGVKKGNKKSKKSRRLVTNLRETPYSLKDGDVVAAVDRLEDESGVADLTRADDEAYREHGKGQMKVKKDKRNRKKNKPASKRPVPEVGLTLGDWDDGADEDESDESDESEGDDLSDMMHF